jgi:predicted small metal-binding protein
VENTIGTHTGRHPGLVKKLANFRGGRWLEGGKMAKVLKCGDVVPGCKEEIKGDSEHDVLRKAAEHAKTAHHMESIPPEVLSKVKGAIHDQGEPRTQKAGSSS